MIYALSERFMFYYIRYTLSFRIFPVQKKLTLQCNLAFFHLFYGPVTGSNYFYGYLRRQIGTQRGNYLCRLDTLVMRPYYSLHAIASVDTKKT